MTDAEPPASVRASTRSLARSSAVIGAGTLLSRITGALRVVALAALGFARLTDTYNLANLSLIHI